MSTVIATTHAYAISDPSTGGILVDTVARYPRASMIAFLLKDRIPKEVPTHLWTDKHVQEAFDRHSNHPMGEHEVVKIRIVSEPDALS